MVRSASRGPFNSPLTSFPLKRSGVKRTVHGSFFWRIPYVVYGMVMLCGMCAPLCRTSMVWLWYVVCVLPCVVPLWYGYVMWYVCSPVSYLYGMVMVCGMCAPLCRTSMVWLWYVVCVFPCVVPLVSLYTLLGCVLEGGVALPDPEAVRDPLLPWNIMTTTYTTHCITMEHNDHYTQHRLWNIMTTTYTTHCVTMEHNDHYIHHTLCYHGT